MIISELEFWIKSQIWLIVLLWRYESILIANFDNTAKHVKDFLY